jgi:hypothetical protein
MLRSRAGENAVDGALAFLKVPSPTKLLIKANGLLPSRTGMVESRALETLDEVVALRPCGWRRSVGTVEG